MSIRIEFLSQDDPLYLLPFFEEFLRHYSKEFEITQLSSCRAMGARSRKKMADELIALYGFGGFAKLATSVVTSKALGKLSKPREAPSFASMEQLCRAFEIPIENIGNPNDPEFVKALQARKPDLIASVACPYLLKKPLLSVPPKGCINIHHAPLPRFKGMMPTFWQLYHGATTVGVTVHYMVPEVDAGDALLRDEMEVRRGETLHELIRRSKRHGAHCMAKAIRAIANGTATRTPMEGPGTKFTFPTKEEIREFHRKGFRAV